MRKQSAEGRSGGYQRRGSGAEGKDTPALRICFSSACSSLAPCFRALTVEGPACGRASVLCVFSPHALLPLLLQSSFALPDHSAVLHAQSEALGACPQMHAPQPPSPLACVTLSQSTFSFLPHPVFMCFLSQTHLDDGATKLFTSKSSLISASSLAQARNYPCPHCGVLLIFQNLLKLFFIFRTYLFCNGEFSPFAHHCAFHPPPLIRHSPFCSLYF